MDTKLCCNRTFLCHTNSKNQRYQKQGLLYATPHFHNLCIMMISGKKKNFDSQWSHWEQKDIAINFLKRKLVHFSLYTHKAKGIFIPGTASLTITVPSSTKNSNSTCCDFKCAAICRAPSFPETYRQKITAFMKKNGTLEKVLWFNSLFFHNLRWCMTTSLKQRKIKFKPRILLSHCATMEQPPNPILESFFHLPLRHVHKPGKSCVEVCIQDWEETLKPPWSPIQHCIQCGKTKIKSFLVFLKNSAVTHAFYGMEFGRRSKQLTT